jgi:ABC-type uncharacterized transport system ATPase subunit
MLTPVDEVKNLSKHYRVLIREAGLKAATKNLFKRKFNIRWMDRSLSVSVSSASGS